MLGAMQRPLGFLCVFMIACTSSAPTEEVAKVDGAKQLEAELENAQKDAIEQAEQAAKQSEEAAKRAEEEAKKAEAEAAKKKAEEAAKLEALQLAGASGTPMFVMLGGTGSRTAKPVANAVLGHSWGWGSASKADMEACEAKASSPGEQMQCGTEDKPKGAAKLLAKLKLAGGKSAFVTPEQIASWKIAAPTNPVWVFGPKHACKATVGRPLVGWYSLHESDEEDTDPDLSDTFTILELAWELTGCDEADESWAPIGVAGALLDPSTRWMKVSPGQRQRFDQATWTGLLASEVAKLPEAAKSREDVEPMTSDPEWWTQTFELPGTLVRELYFAAVWRDAEGSKAPDEYQCGDDEFVEVFQVELSSTGATIIGRGSRGQLAGALVTGAAIHSLVWNDTLDYQVAKLEPTGLGESVELATGVYYPEDYGERDYTLLPYCGP
jgi:hypothetical protein